MSVIVIGSGIAGLSAALALQDRGEDDILIVTKGALMDSATAWAQGGIASALDEADSPDLHEQDTLAAGAGLCDPDAVRVLVTEGVPRVLELIQLGVAFDRVGDDLHYAQEAAHSIARVLHAGGDATGSHIERALAEAVRRRAIPVLEHAFVTRLVVTHGAVSGIVLLDGTTLSADAVVLATGGGGQLFPRTTNPLLSTADGVALAIRAGAAIADLEFYQFHPTAFAPEALARPGTGAWRFLVSEAVRGDGAILRNVHGEAFMRRYDARAELAPRDVVARALAQEMRATGTPWVTLDATGIPDFARHFPTIDGYCRSQGIDPAVSPIPVAPAAHYMMGGAWTDTWGRTTLPGLYAAGEVASSGVHGANRLASNSLLEGIVFGTRVAQAITDPPAAPPHLASGTIHEHMDLEHVPGGTLPPREDLQALLWTSTGIERTGVGLLRAATTLAAWAGATPGAAPESAGLETLETANLALTGWVMTCAALARTESRGAHARDDYPYPDPAWQHRQAWHVRDVRPQGPRRRRDLPALATTPAGRTS